MTLGSLQDKLDEIIKGEEDAVQTRYAEKQLTSGRFTSLIVQTHINERLYKQNFQYAYMRPLAMYPLYQTPEDENDDYEILFVCDGYQVAITGQGMPALFDLIGAQSIHHIAEGERVAFGKTTIEVHSITIRPPE